MADVDTNDVIEIVSKAEFAGGDDVVNVYQAKITDPQTGTAQETLDWVEEWLEALITPLATRLSDQLVSTEITVDNLTQAKFLGDVTPSFVGLSAADPTSPQIVALVIARTATKGVQGRKSIGVLTEDNQAGGNWDAATIAVLEVYGDAWKDSLVAANDVAGTGIVVTKVAGALTAEHPITSIRVIADTRTQRRRTLGRGS